MNKSFVLPLF